MLTFWRMNTPRHFSEVALNMQSLHWHVDNFADAFLRT